jgi:hypothetical protein
MISDIACNPMAHAKRAIFEASPGEMQPTFAAAPRFSRSLFTVESGCVTLLSLVLSIRVM